jgi:hypothetical protein
LFSSKALILLKNSRPHTAEPAFVPGRDGRLAPASRYPRAWRPSRRLGAFALGLGFVLERLGFGGFAAGLDFIGRRFMALAAILPAVRLGRKKQLD